ncbi:oligosaccharide flippase family protein [uncultured Fusobacterium sp.]|uniref:lipopolysaccharide biosynthesis protein n=1 Tax=uncultured Fusobacterium sp. TaxID=159267 RepID=UPI0025E59D22|nr:oligosaccharide flippase family protein [uncultured Fusobacterium sp.]
MIKKFFSYALAVGLEKISMYFLLPIYLKYLTIDEFGKYEYLLTICLFIIPFGILGMDTVKLRFYKFRDEKYNKKINYIVGNICFLGFILYSLIILIFWKFNKEIFSNSLLIGISIYLRICSFGASDIYMNELRMNEKTKKYLILVILNLILSVLLGIIILDKIENKFLAVNLSLSLSKICSGSLGIIFVIRNINIHIKNYMNLLREVLSYSIPNFFNKLNNIILSLGDKIMLKILLNYEALAMYGAGFKIGAIVQILVQGFSMYWPAEALRIYEKIDAKNIVESRLKKTILVVPLLNGVFIFFIKILYNYLYPKEYQEAFKIVIIISIVYFLSILDFFISIGFFYKKKSLETFFISLFCSFFNIILNYFFIIKFDYYGAALSTLVIKILNLSLRKYRSDRFFLINLEKKYYFYIISYIILGLKFNIYILFIYFFLLLVLLLDINKKYRRIDLND